MKKITLLQAIDTFIYDHEYSGTMSGQNIIRILPFEWEDFKKKLGAKPKLPTIIYVGKKGKK